MEKEFKVNKEVLNRWQNFGLLQGVIDELQWPMAYAFEETAKILESSTGGLLGENIKMLSFPIVRRVLASERFRNLEYSKENLDSIVDRILSQMISEKEKINKLENKTAEGGIDEEGEYCAKFADEFEI